MARKGKMPSGFKKMICVKNKMQDGSSKTDARKACGVKSKRKR